MRNLNQDTVTQAVLARLADTPEPRLRQLLTSLVQHLHAFARETRLTEEEWKAGIDFLTAVGQQCGPTRQEFALLSDVLGLSMLTVAMNNGKPQGCTEATVLGSLEGAGAPPGDLGSHPAQGAEGAEGEACLVRGRVLSLDRQPLAGAQVEVWPADAPGQDGTPSDGADRLPGPEVTASDADGRFACRATVAQPHRVATDGPVGDLLRATRRHPWRPAHLQFRIRADGHETLVTRVFREGDPYLDSDAVFGVRQSLVAPWVRQPDGLVTLDFDFVLNPRCA